MDVAWEGEKLFNEIFVDYDSTCTYDSDDENKTETMYGCLMVLNEEVSADGDYDMCDDLSTLSYKNVGEVELFLDYNDMSIENGRMVDYACIEHTITINVVPAIGKHIGDTIYRREYLLNGKERIHKYTILGIK